MMPRVWRWRKRVARAEDRFWVMFERVWVVLSQVLLRRQSDVGIGLRLMRAWRWWSMCLIRVDCAVLRRERRKYMVPSWGLSQSLPIIVQESWIRLRTSSFI